MAEILMPNKVYFKRKATRQETWKDLAIPLLGIDLKKPKTLN